MTRNAKKSFNYPKWAFILGTPISLIMLAITLFRIPASRCWILKEFELTSPSCDVPADLPNPEDQLVTVQLVTLTEEGLPLANVKVSAIGTDVPIPTFTDDNGYGEIQVQSKGKVRVTLVKSGYPTQNFIIDLQNDPELVRIIQLNQSGEPEVEAAQTVPRVPTPIPTLELKKIQENDFMKMELTGREKVPNGDVKFAFRITNKLSENLYLARNLNSQGSRVTDEFGGSCSSSIEGLLDAGLNSTVDQFSVISPNSSITVNWRSNSSCNFASSTEFDASFPLLYHKPSSSSSSTQNIPFNVSFTDITVVTDIKDDF